MKYTRKLFSVCIGARCNDAARGCDRGEEIQAELKALNHELGRKETVRVCRISCLDMCDHGPNMIGPDGELYSHLTREKAREVYLKESGKDEREG